MTPTEHGTHDAIVIGAGITGLATASRIAAAGYDVLILEARDRVGGRLLTVADADGHPTIDLGPSWFWADETRVQALVRELDIRTHAQHIAGDALFQPGGAVQRIAGNPIDAPAMRFQDGAQSLALALSERLGPSLRCNTPVAGVRVIDDHVEVDHREGTSRARCAVVAVPPALAITDIRFEPGLPDELADLAARTPVWMGAMTKVVAEYATPFWRDHGLAGAAISYTGPLRELHDLSGPRGQSAALFGFAMPMAEPLSRATIVDQLVDLFGQDARNPRTLHVQDWRGERWTSPAHVEALGDYGTYADPRFRHAIHERIWLASTETGPDHAGHIEGALAAADLVGAAACAVLAHPN
ncbi:MAG: FAD-dependent oxidoreductase [Thermoleophilia bacterium]